ncbi:MAG: tRNA lysidine(34) synthetase TilS [Gemmataceae bacterium]|nr:tRNA lysidine(34) synthetase TilS [Gemmataceae bacterium]
MEPVDLVSRVADFLHREALTASRGVVAVSGGPDSVALAHALAGVLPADRIVLAHVNHQLRGAASDADEAFVQALPTAWGRPDLVVETHRLDVARLAEAGRCNLEDAARQARYGWLTELSGRVGAAWVATGHTLDDQAETVLHHFLRGSGLRGLAGMRGRRKLAPAVELVRPLLSVRRSDVLAYLHARSLTYRDDASNADPTYTRNRLRHELLPRLSRDYNPRLAETLSRTARQLGEVADWLAEHARRLLSEAELPRAGSVIVVRRAPLQAAAPVVVREVLRWIWQREQWPQRDMGFADWQRAAELVGGADGGNDFPGGVRVRCVGQVVQLERCPAPPP